MLRRRALLQQGTPLATAGLALGREVRWQMTAVLSRPPGNKGPPQPDEALVGVVEARDRDGWVVRLEPRVRSRSELSPLQRAAAASGAVRLTGASLAVATRGILRSVNALEDRLDLDQRVTVFAVAERTDGLLGTLCGMIRTSRYSLSNLT